jgi:hypothetical protein
MLQWVCIENGGKAAATQMCKIYKRLVMTEPVLAELVVMTCASVARQRAFISYKDSKMASLRASVDVRGQEIFDSMPNLSISGAARSARSVLAM